MLPMPTIRLRAVLTSRVALMMAQRQSVRLTSTSAQQKAIAIWRNTGSKWGNLLRKEKKIVCVACGTGVTVLRLLLVGGSRDKEPVNAHDVEALGKTSLSKLLTGWLAFAFCSSPSWVDISETLYNALSSMPIASSFTHFFVMKIFFNQFLGGETTQDCIPKIQALRQRHIGTLLGYNIEAELDGSSKDPGLIRPQVQHVLESIETQSQLGRKFCPDTSATSGDNRSWIRIKVTGLLSHPIALLHDSEAILEAREARNLDKDVPYPGLLHDGDWEAALNGTQATTSDRQQLVDLYATLDTIMKKGRECNFLDQQIRRAQEKGYKLLFKQVRGAYIKTEGERWHKEVRQGPGPVWGTKAETDASYNYGIEKTLATVKKQIQKTGNPEIGAVFATHNFYSIDFGIRLLETHGLAKRRSGNDKLIVSNEAAGSIAFGQIYGKTRNSFIWLGRYSGVNLIKGMKDDFTNKIAGSISTENGFPLVIKSMGYGDLNGCLPFLARRATENKAVLEGRGGASAERIRNIEISAREEALKMGTVENQPETELKRGFKNRHVNMFAIAGSIGTDLIIGSGEVLASGGPGSMLIAYLIMGACVYTIMTAFAEMAIFAPMSKGFSGYATRFVDPALGFATGWNYFFKYAVLLANKLTATGLVIRYWIEDLNVGVWIAVFGVFVVALNFLPVENFGETEFVMAIVKITVLIGLIICCSIVSLGGSPSGERVGFRYWKEPGAFASYLAEAHSCSWDVVGITYEEARNPRKAIPRAVKQTIWRIAVFCIGGVIVLGTTVPYTNDLLLSANNAETSASASPFVVALKLAGVETLPGITSIASRTLYGLARDKQAPSIFMKTNRWGVPVYAVTAASLFCCLAFLNVSNSSSKIFGYFVSISIVLGLINWVNIIIIYYCFQRGIKAQGITRAGLPWKGPLQPYGVCLLGWGSAISSIPPDLLFLSHPGRIPSPFPQNTGYEMNEEQNTGSRRVSNAYLRRLRQAAGSTGERMDEDLTWCDDDMQSQPPRTETTPQPPRNRDGQPASLPNQPFQTPILIESSSNAQIEASNPLASTSSAYLSDDKSRLRCLGESSTWSFTHKTLRLMHSHLDVQEPPLTEITTNEESRAYPLSWGSSGFEDPASFSDLPSADYALYLVNGFKFHVGQLYHLFDESRFMRLLNDFYNFPVEVARNHKIWYVQFLTILGLAKSLVVQPSRGAITLPGSSLFLRAMSLLPDTPYLFSDALTAVETLCAISLYLQCADSRNSAYVYIGSALRMAVTFGLHRERPTNDWSPEATERCHRIWWTVYVLDRTFSFSMGVPISIQDSDITTPMPERDRPGRGTSLYIHVRLSNLISEVVNKVYGAEGRLQSSFLPCVRKVLGSIASIASDLNECCPLSSDGSDGSISRVAAHLHLLYHQAILLTMYPLLLHLFQTKLQSGESNIEPTRAFSATTRALLSTCTETCNNMLRILSVLQQQGLLGGALPFDLERTFSSGFVSVMLSFVGSNDKSQPSLYQPTCQLLDEFISRGSTPARFRKSEIELLQNMILQWNSTTSSADCNARDQAQGHLIEQQPETQSRDKPSDPIEADREVGATYDLSPGQILSLAEMVDVGGGHSQGDVDWIDGDLLWNQSMGWNDEI
ncbi:putative amino-acid permease [Aspergillus affinis]|uniref:putative amino-acid permease n=1 Tax=Aspergillus affinis TaxID=1070780 RepID=UPI0022FEE9CA|nr:putative amino-acid permease [Aspergillus affinis]KAI9041792.1 putative amino-acid permease [Aspergillus affinis]